MRVLISFLLIGFLFSGRVTAQSILTGFIKDGNGAPVDGASVKVKSTKLFSIADANGKFVIQSPGILPFTLSISSAGYYPADVEVKELKDSVLNIVLVDNSKMSEVVITSRRRIESAQNVPIAISVVSGAQVDNAGAFNVNRLKELVPSVQLYTSNPRNTGINIRGLGSPFGLTNDGLDPGVGFYVDGVYFARPAAATLDFIDIEQVEVLRGPQGTLFGKNTTSGAFNITTRKPTFKSGANFELSYGNFAFIQAKASVTGALNKKLAGRISFSGTSRNGLIQNVRTNQFTNELNNIGVRGQLLYKPFENTSVILAGDFTNQRPDGYAQVVAGVVQTKRPAFRQFNAIIADLNYQLPSLNAFDRKIDHDVPWNSGNDLGGVSLNIDQKIGNGKLTSTTAWRYWDWDPSNDRDFTGLEALAKSQNPSKHRNLSQEIRYAGEISSRLSGVVGLFYINQEINTNGLEESGRHQWRFVQTSTSPLWQTPGLFEGFGIRTKSSIKSQSAAAFANIDWEVIKGLHILPGIRFNYDKKDVRYSRVASGGLDTATFNGTTAQKVALQGFKNSVYTNQSYVADAEENNFTYQLTVAYRPNHYINAFATYSTSFKPVGVNVAGLPTINGQPATNLAVIKPEYVTHYEMGIKSNPSEKLILNAVFHNTDIKDYQANVQSPELGVNRGYIANAEAVNVKGVEIDANYQLGNRFSLFGAFAYTDGKYVKFTNAPLPLEETGLTENGVQKAFKDISGGRLPGISKWSGSLGGELTVPGQFFAKEGKFFVALESFYRSEFSSSPSPSAFLNIEGYTLVNTRFGFRAAGTGFSAFVWGRNIFNKNYFEQLLPAGGNAGHYGAVLGDQRTFGVTLRYSL
ncbi:MAG TPA: TonB-dependent receptor [Lacibacter sp.]|nr:TonB-dependent receptor [Lacibacter sp.]HMO87761.1 TonB-dependent receptor [Lacibacter sp.]HMP85689.1 TonB-dependent receptor [Lacibacter sp.]